MKRIILLAALFCTGCLSKSVQTNNDYEEVIVPVEHEYNEVSEYELTWDSIFDVGEEKYYVYFYSTTCNHCQELKNYIIEKALVRGDIYFVKGTSKDQLTNDSKKLIGAEKPEDFYILGYPSIVQISNKKCAKNFAGISQIKSEIK